MSCNTADAPEAVVPALASQVSAPTVQLNALAVQSAGGVTQVGEVAVPHAPFVQVKLAAPVAGAVMSCSATDEPEVVSATAALQALFNTDQFNVVAAQSAGGVTQVAPVSALHAPFVQEKLATPVLGAVTSCNATDEPDVVKATNALQVLPDTVQLNEPAAQSIRGVTVVVVVEHVIDVGVVLQAPFVHA
jgi:hypothetical protein